METRIFINLCVQDLSRSKEFFARLGFRFHPRFTNEVAACVVISEHIFAMLLTEKQFELFSPNPVCDATHATEVLLCLSRESREAVDDLVRKAVAAGGRTYKEPIDHGVMYGHGFQDLDGHVWELLHMDDSLDDDDDDDD